MVDLSTSIAKGDKIYLINESKNKFWEALNSGSGNWIKYGKWHKGVESRVIQGFRQYESLESSLNRLMEIVILKTDKGYITLKKENTERGRVNNSFAQLIYSGSKHEAEIEIDLD